MKLGASGENGSERLFCVRILCMSVILLLAAMVCLACLFVDKR